MKTLKVKLKSTVYPYFHMEIWIERKLISKHDDVLLTRFEKCQDPQAVVSELVYPLYTKLTVKKKEQSQSQVFAPTTLG